VIVFNLPALVICAIAFGAGFGVRHLAGASGEGLAMVVAGPIAAALDLAWRMRNDRNWFRPAGGGALFWLPVWAFGILWLVLGVVYMVRG
jgi:hypothetical protein